MLINKCRRDKKWRDHGPAGPGCGHLSCVSLAHLPKSHDTSQPNYNFKYADPVQSILAIDYWS